MPGRRTEVTSTPFFARVYAVVARIPRGRVATYGQLALLLGRPNGARTVGWAMQSAPAGPNLPCHRVVRASGEPAPDHVFGGRAAQRRLLAAEGVTFLNDGRVDMEAHLWEVAPMGVGRLVTRTPSGGPLRPDDLQQEGGGPARTSVRRESNRKGGRP